MSTTAVDQAQGTAVVVVNGFLSFIGTFGNFLIVFAVLKTPQLIQRPSNHLILSLAVTDLVATMVAQPLHIASTALKTFESRCSFLLERALLIVGPFSCSCSAFHLAAISIDRVISAVKPHQHNETMKKWSKIMLPICWGTATILAALLIKFPKLNLILQSLVMLCGVVMICSYGIILYKITCSPKITTTTTTTTSNPRERAMQNRVTMTIAVVILLFAACWLPLVGYVLAHRERMFFCSFDTKLIWIRTLLMANSSMNFIIYSFRIRQFRSAYIIIICRMLQPFSQIVGKCFRKRSVQQNSQT